MTAKATTALAYSYAELGWRVVPIKPKTKRPPMAGWQNVATTDQDTIRRWWDGIYAGHGVGIATGQESGVWILDVDTAKGGLEALKTLTAEHGGLPKGPRVNTGGGGFHLYFLNPPGLHVATTKNIAGSGLDVRGDGGQALMPPTKHAEIDCPICTAGGDCPKLDYVWAPGRGPKTSLLAAPEWLLDLVVPERAQPAPPPPVALDFAQASVTGVSNQEGSAAAEITAAHDWHTLLMGDGWSLASTASNGDTSWTRPGKDKRQGVSAILHEPEGPLVNYSTTAHDLCQSWAHNPGSDCWSYSIFGYLAATRAGGDRSGLASEWRQRQTATQQQAWDATSGGVSPGGDPQAYPGAPSDSTEGHGEASLDLSWAHLVDWADFWTQDHTAEQWCIWPLVPRGRAIALYAPAKAGKSSIVLAAVAAAATGQPVFGLWTAPEPVSVLYLDYEMTPDDIWERLHDLGYGPEWDMSHLHYSMLPSILPLDMRQGAEQIVALAQHVGAQLVVIDTFSRAVKGDENDADTSRDFYRYTGMALKGAGIACLRTDHAGKVAEQGQRGSSAKNDDVDVVWSLERVDGGVKITRTHSRVTWVPENVAINHIEHDDGTIAYRVAENRQWPTGTKELAQLLDRLGVGLKASGREAARLLREAGESAKNERIRAAQQYREAHALDAWAAPARASEDGLL